MNSSLLRSLARHIRKISTRTRTTAPPLNLTLIDVGASYFLHKPWIPLILAKRVRLIAVDPNAQNLSYLDSYPAIAVTKVSEALSSSPGEQTLYVTNVDSGSSLFPPKPSREDFLRSPQLRDYLFPVREEEINVTTLDLLPITGNDAVALKIDTQGAELEILKGAASLLKQRRIMSVEAEVSLLSRPIMSGAPNLQDIASFLEKFGMELVWIRPTNRVKRSFKAQERQTEADVLFTLNKEIVIEMGGNYISAYKSVLEAYGLEKEIELLETLATDKVGLG